MILNVLVCLTAYGHAGMLCIYIYILCMLEHWCEDGKKLEG